MKSIQEIARWVIDNRYSKGEKEKISDLEMYQTIVEGFYKLSKATDGAMSSSGLIKTKLKIYDKRNN